MSGEELPRPGWVQTRYGDQPWQWHWAPPAGKNIVSAPQDYCFAHDENLNVTALTDVNFEEVEVSNNTENDEPAIAVDSDANIEVLRPGLYEVYLRTLGYSKNVAGTVNSRLYIDDTSWDSMRMTVSLTGLAMDAARSSSDVMSDMLKEFNGGVELWDSWYFGTRVMAFNEGTKLKCKVASSLVGAVPTTVVTEINLNIIAYFV